MAVGIAVGAQDIRARRIKKVPLKHEAFYPSFGQKSYQILLSGNDGDVVSMYNTRFRREKQVSELDPTQLMNVTQSGENHLQVRTTGKQMELVSPNADPVVLAPAGDHFYIWVSLSPDKKQLLFTAAGKGTFISDLHGSILKELGYLNSPTWMNNQWILGMKDLDDGHQVKSSDIITIHVPSGIRKNLTTGSDEVALNPRASEAADRIVFHNMKGEVFTMRIRIRD